VAEDLTAAPEVDKLTAVNRELLTAPIRGRTFEALSETEVPWIALVTVTTMDASMSPSVGEAKVGIVVDESATLSVIV
jgi:hypothetical protein